MFAAGYRILFQGDSITDAGRDRTRREVNDAQALGRGYAYLAAARLLADQPRQGLMIWNRGISGHRVPDLLARWQEDCLDLQPDVVSILIGVNDLWHKFDGRYTGTVADYEQGYRELLEQTRQALPRAEIVIGEPFVLRCGVVSSRWFPEFDQRREVAGRLAREFQTRFVPFQSSFERALTDGSPPSYWAADGVHPTAAGHQLLADTWLRVVAS
ncbi:MAG TPA: SGNH/GDSL hydrolase family protein [Polyangiaceae bacterium]|jgi:lysophospholipase L1-like esterase|nr:SGNH/GDSL hydrolase family protein [Polyangiaceae bacterium]